MRLTLRTLLAYRDRVLSETELIDLHKRIQQSEMAGNLLKRIEALSKRPQLLAPKVDGRGLGSDANSVAEYLDDILQSDKVPELERVCLESDVHLAELAQCHELLSAALSTPVDVNDELNDRIVGLLDEKRRAMETEKLIDNSFDSTIDASDAVNLDSGMARSADGQRKRIDAQHMRESAGQIEKQPSSRVKSHGEKPVRTQASPHKTQPVESPMVASGGQSIRPAGLDLEGAQLAQEVPEYLRGRTRDGWRGPLAIGALAAVLALLVWQSLGPLENVRQMFAARRTPVVNTIPQPSNPVDVASTNVGEGSGNLAAEVAPNKGAVNDSGTKSKDKSGETITETPSSAEGANSKSANLAEPPSSSNSSTPVQSVPSSKNNVPSPTISKDVVPPEAAPPQVSGEMAAAAVEWLPADMQEKRAVILAIADDSAGVRRLAPSESLASGSRIVVPPATRATLDLARQMRWTVCGPTRMVVKHDVRDAARPPVVELTLARALIASGPNARDVELLAGSWRGRVSLEAPGSIAAVELSYKPVALGSVADPRAVQPVLSIISVSEGLSITPVSTDGQLGERVSLKVGEGFGVVGSNAPQRFSVKEIPAWYRGIAERPIDVQAADDLHRNLANNPKVNEVLAGLLLSRRPETAAISAQTLALLGQWDGIAGPASLLNSVAARSHWATTLDLVRQILAAEPHQATQLRMALMSSEPKRGNLLCDLILGLPEDRLKTDATETLVGLLESEFLSERVLAGYQLKQLTGKDLGYQASDVDRTVIQQWRRELTNKRIRILTPGSPF